MRQPWLGKFNVGSLQWFRFDYISKRHRVREKWFPRGDLRFSTWIFEKGWDRTNSPVKICKWRLEGWHINMYNAPSMSRLSLMGCFWKDDYKASALLANRWDLLQQIKRSAPNTDLSLFEGLLFKATRCEVSRREDYSADGIGLPSCRKFFHGR